MQHWQERKIPRPVRQLGSAWIPGLLGLAIGWGTVPAGAREVAAGAPENAAFYYWEAAGSLSNPRSEAELAVYRFIDEELDAYPPAVFVLRPDVLRALLDEAPLLQALSTAARQPRCRFDTGAETSPLLTLRHLPAMDRCARRALHAFLAYEYVRNDEGSVRILETVWTLAAHLDEDRNLRSALAGASLIDRSAGLLEGYLGRDPTIEAVEQLIKFFDAHPGPFFKQGEMLRVRSRAFAEWLREDPEQAEQKILTLYRDTEVRPAVDQLRTLDPERKRERLDVWLDAFTAFSDEQAEAVDLSYSEGLVVVRSMDEKFEEMRAQAPSGAGNPVVSLLAQPALETIYERLLLSEAQYRAMEVLTHAARYHLLVGRWPDDLDILEAFGARTLPRDPYSQKPFHYSLRGKAPRLTVRVPRWIAQAGDLVYHFELAARKEADTKRLSDYAARTAASRSREPDSGNGEVPVGR